LAVSKFSHSYVLNVFVLFIWVCGGFTEIFGIRFRFQILFYLDKSILQVDNFVAHMSYVNTCSC